VEDAPAATIKTWLSVLLNGSLALLPHSAAHKLENQGPQEPAAPVEGRHQRSMILICQRFERGSTVLLQHALDDTWVYMTDELQIEDVIGSIFGSQGVII
jgi:hypothetical protein